jgi:hypothetical protein
MTLDSDLEALKEDLASLAFEARLQQTLVVAEIARLKRFSNERDEFIRVARERARLAHNCLLRVSIRKAVDLKNE